MRNNRINQNRPQTYFVFANQRTISRCLHQLRVTTVQSTYISLRFCPNRLRFVVECRKTISNYQRKLSCIQAYRLVSNPPVCNGDLHKATDSWERFWVEVAGNRQPGRLDSYYVVRSTFLVVQVSSVADVSLNDKVPKSGLIR